jgi:hypothetical protein
MYDLIANRMMAGGPLYELHEERARTQPARQPVAADRALRRPGLLFGRWLRAAQPRSTDPCLADACMAC